MDVSAAYLLDMNLRDSDVEDNVRKRPFYHNVVTPFTLAGYLSRCKYKNYFRKFQIIRRKSTFRAQRTGGRRVTLLAERRSAPCCVTESREVSNRQSVGEQWLAGRRVTVSREVIGIENVQFLFCPY